MLVERATCKSKVPGIMLVERADGGMLVERATCKSEVPGMLLVERAVGKYARGESYQ